jgi:S1-C subfamily serine protease
VSEVAKNSPAQKAGVRGGDTLVEISGTPVFLGGDILLAIDEQAVSSSQDIKQAMLDKKPGDKAVLKILRDKKTIELSLIVELAL